MHETTNLHEKFPNSIFTDYELEERFETCSQPDKVTDVFSVINNRGMAWWAETDISLLNKFSPYKESTNIQKDFIAGETGKLKMSILLNTIKQLVYYTN